MDIRILRYFLAVAREENITRAAQSLHIAQPSLSRQLMELEQEVGKPLLVRGKRKITLTEDGVLLRKRAEEIVALVDKTAQELAAGEQNLSGEVLLGGAMQPCILRAAAALRGRHPAVRFGFYSGDATDLTERLEHGTLDFVTLPAPVDTVKYEALPLPEVTYWGLLVRADSPSAAHTRAVRADVLREPLIMHRRAGLQQLISAWAQTESENLNIAATYNIINGSAVRMVRSGLGSLLTTRDQLAEEPSDGVRFLPLDPPLQTHYVLARKRGALLSKPAQAFLRQMEKVEG